MGTPAKVCASLYSHIIICFKVINWSECITVICPFTVCRNLVLQHKFDNKFFFKKSRCEWYQPLFKIFKSILSA